MNKKQMLEILQIEINEYKKINLNSEFRIAKIRSLLSIAEISLRIILMNSGINIKRKLKKEVKSFNELIESAEKNEYTNKIVFIKYGLKFSENFKNNLKSFRDDMAHYKYKKDYIFSEDCNIFISNIESISNFWLEEVLLYNKL